MTTKIIIASLLILTGMFTSSAVGQGTAFTYQGKLTDAGVPASGSYDLTFRLFNVSSLGTQIGDDIELQDIAVAAGIFTVSLDFGASPFQSNTGNFLEISVRPGAGTGAFTPLSPLQPITSSPYAVQTLRAESAATADNSNALGGTPASSFVQITDPRLSDERNPTAGSPRYIQNFETPQAATNFSIAGDGTIGGTLTGGIVRAATRFDIGPDRVLSVNPGFFNTFLGVGAGRDILTGNANSIFGNNSGRNLTTGSFNSFFGNRGDDFKSGFLTGTGYSTTSGSFNSFYGHRTGEGNTTGSVNSFFGTGAGLANVNGHSNSFFGHDAGNSNTSGSFNTAIGKDADVAAGDMNFATAIGANAVVSSSDTIVIGKVSGTYDGLPRPADVVQIPGNLSVAGIGNFTNASGVNATQFTIGGARVLSVGGTFNTFVGIGAGNANPTGDFNTFVGRNAGLQMASGTQNSFFGMAAGVFATGNRNTFVGRSSGVSLVEGDDNVFIGTQAGRNFVGGSGNIAIGSASANICGFTPDGVGSNNIFIGTGFGGCANPGLSNTIAIGTFAFGSDEVRIGNTTHSVKLGGNVSVGKNISIGFDELGTTSTISWQRASVGSNLTLCWSSGNKQIDTCVSSLRYKENVRDLDTGIGLIKKLRPVSFDWKIGKDPDIGLIAEEVAEIDPNLAIFDQNGQVDGVKYDRIGVVLINVVKQQQTQIERQQKQIDDLMAVICSIKPDIAACTKNVKTAILNSDIADKRR